MNIKCDCGKFKAKINDLKKNSPGRLVCYCNDCQEFLKKMGRQDILDPYGGTEVIPVYPNSYEFLEGEEYLKCNVLQEKGLHRWSVTCCNTPVGNTLAKFPWVGVPHNLFTNFRPGILESLGEVKCRVKGKFKTSNPPFKVSDNLSLRDAFSVIPFVLKGFIFKKFKHSPFFKEDNITPIHKTEVLKEPISS